MPRIASPLDGRSDRRGDTGVTPAVSRRPRGRRRRIAFGWYGGKFSHLE
jgi:hypothetical protein